MAEKQTIKTYMEKGDLENNRLNQEIFQRRAQTDQGFYGRLMSSGYCGQINKKFYHYMSGIVGMTTTFSLMKIYVIATLITSKQCY